MSLILSKFGPKSLNQFHQEMPRNRENRPGPRDNSLRGWGYITRPEVSKLTPKNKRNSQVTKLSPAQSSEATNRLTDISQNFKAVYKYLRNVSKSLRKVAHLELE